MSKLNRELLDADIPKDVISQREGGGGKRLDYLQGWYVIDRLNQVIGHGNWSSQVVELTHLGDDKTTNSYGKESFKSYYRAKVSISVRGDGQFLTSHEDVGFGDGSDPKEKFKAHELAMKEAVTDALKRAAKNLGRSMGLALYDKERQYVEDDVKVTVNHVYNPVAADKKRVIEEIKEATKPVLSRDKVNALITGTAKALDKRGIQMLEVTKELIRSKYGVARKEDLEDDKALELAQELQNLLNQ